MDSINGLRASVKEINTILKYAAMNTSNITKYQMFNKIAVVFLSTKFEVFIEDFMEEHSLKILQGHKNTTMPNNLKNSFVDTAVEYMASVKNRGKKNDYLSSLIKLVKNDGDSINDIANIRPATKFNYGKHGQKEVEAIFVRYGLEAFIRSPKVQNCLTMFNSLIAIRNNVIHQDASPSLTHQTIKGHMDNIMKFVDMLETDITDNKLMYYNKT